ncbi:hypothetical protein [Pseudarthrobacter cellobiosi]|uniref:hypothetical protein n=1 Tax=Pseudarthrobacter cellobiosi TaxID=2953654 RepID=UPI00208E539E|nr:hypothetical protein [Pseudarthrobacter sp. HLT1-5]MCO4257360.1 hypothetical protein [Pseudarthrobacter sp. HLT1-5]
MSPDQCYCRGAGICDNNHHICEACTCEHDGAPHTQAEVTSGHVNPSSARLDAWQEKLEATR